QVHPQYLVCLKPLAYYSSFVSPAILERSE
ncbi:unnamed protein product, partial [marine sediment metagenome]